MYDHIMVQATAITNQEKQQCNTVQKPSRHCPGEHNVLDQEQPPQHAEAGKDGNEVEYCHKSRPMKIPDAEETIQWPSRHRLGEHKGFDQERPHQQADAGTDGNVNEHCRKQVVARIASQKMSLMHVPRSCDKPGTTKILNIIELEISACGLRPNNAKDRPAQ